MLAQTSRERRTERYVLRLYVTGMTPRSIRAVENVRTICEEHLHGRYQLEVIDVYQQPTLAKGEQIIAAPTLIKKLPLPLAEDHRRHVQHRAGAPRPGPQTFEVTGDGRRGRSQPGRNHPIARPPRRGGGNAASDPRGRGRRTAGCRRGRRPCLHPAQCRRSIPGAGRADAGGCGHRHHMPATSSTATAALRKWSPYRSNGSSAHRSISSSRAGIGHF